MMTKDALQKCHFPKEILQRLWRKRYFEILLASVAFIMSLSLAAVEAAPQQASPALSPIPQTDKAPEKTSTIQHSSTSGTAIAQPKASITAPQTMVILATSPQEPQVKAYGDLGNLIGGMVSRNISLELQGTQVLSPLEASAQLQRNGRMADRHYLLGKLDVKQGFSNQDAALVIQGLNLKGKPEQFLILRSDIDFTRPYAPPTRWAKFVSWFRDSMNEEAWGYVDVDVVRYDLNTQGTYTPHHQWHDTFRLPTDRITSVSTSVYDDPTANTWGSRLGQEVFEAYWKRHCKDYGVIPNVNPLNRIELPTRAQLKFDESKFPAAAPLNVKIDTLPLKP